jgi:hypothetical protein
METYSKVDLKSGVNTFSFFNEWKKSLGLGEFRCVIEGHVHKLGISYHDDDLKNY